MKITWYEGITFLFFLIGLLVVFAFVVIYFSFNPWIASLDFFDLLLSSKYILLSTLVISAILLFSISAVSLRLSFQKKKKQWEQTVGLRENYIQIIMPFFKANECKFEQLRMEMWNAYNANAQNHTSHILTIVVALVAFIAGWETLSKNIVLGLISLFVLSGGLVLIFSWLMLRNKYWSVLSSQLMVLSSDEIVTLFNKWNAQSRVYQKNLPHCSAVITYALHQRIADLEEDCSWIYHPLSKLVLWTISV